MPTRYMPLTLVRGDGVPTQGDLLKDPTLPVPWVASAPGLLKDGFDLKADEWDLARYETHPIVLFGHDHGGFVSLPIGTGDARIEGEELRIDVTYDIDDPFAMRVRSKALKRMMGSSVGWDHIEEADPEEEDGRMRVRNELIEFSMVPVGMDPRALPQIQKAGLRSLHQALTQYVNEEFPAEGQEEGEEGNESDPTRTEEDNEHIFSEAQIKALGAMIRHSVEIAVEKGLEGFSPTVVTYMPANPEPKPITEDLFLSSLLAE